MKSALPAYGRLVEVDLQVVIDPIREQAKRDLLALIGFLVFIIPPALGGLLLASTLYQWLLPVASNTPAACVETIALVVMLGVGGIAGGLTGQVISMLVMKRFLSSDELYKWAISGGYLPVFTPLSIAVARVALGGVRPARTQEGLLAQLKSMGFYKYSEPDRPVKVPHETADSHWVYDPSTLRFYRLNESDFTSRDFPGFARKLRPFLEREGITFGDMRQEANDKGLLFSRNGRAYVVSTPAEERAGGEGAHYFARALAITNDLLREAGSNERLYVVSVDQQLSAAFLTPDMYGLLLASPLIKNREKPISASTLMAHLHTGG